MLLGRNCCNRRSKFSFQTGFSKLNLVVRIVEGAAIIEAAEIDRRSPIRVTTGKLQVLIVSSGTYRFAGGTALVLDGKLRTADGSTTIKKGNEITSIAGSYTVTHMLGSPSGELDVWSYFASSAPSGNG
jgi:hypothetical protein